MKKGKEVNKPFWAFALATAHKPYPIPTLAHLRLQMFSNLAYGAQGLQYFTYFSPGTTIWNFHQAPIDHSGKRTEIYDQIKELNEEIQGLSPVFIGAEVISVAHIGDTIPNDTKRLEALPTPVKSISCEGSDGAVVSHLKNDGREFLVVVNRDFQRKMILDIELDPTVDRVMKDGILISSTLYSSKMGIDPGDILIYTWE